MNTTSHASATARAPMTDAPEVLGAIDPPTDHQPHRPRRPAAAPGRDLRPLHIGGVEIAQDEHGRYSLNDMHRAAMAAGSATESQRPGEFLRSAGVQAFLSALDTSGLTAGIHAVKTGEGATAEPSAPAWLCCVTPHGSPRPLKFRCTNALTT